MPLIFPSDCPTLDIEDRLRALLAADPDLVGLRSGEIREMIPTAVDPEEGMGYDAIVVALQTVGESFGPATTGSVFVNPRLALVVLGYEPQKNPDVKALRRRLAKTHHAFRTALWKYRRDPGTDCLWYGLRFPTGDATRYQRLPGQYQLYATEFYALTHKDNP